MNPENLSFNIRPYMMIALGGNAFLHEEIDNIYEQNKAEYYELYRNGDMYKDKAFTIFMIDKEDQMKKVAGITEWCYENNDFELLYRLIKKGYKYCWNFFKQRKDITVRKNGQTYSKNIVIDEFSLSFIKRAGGEGKVSDIEIFYNEIILLYLCYKENIKLYLDTEYGQFFKQNLRDDMLSYYAKDINFSSDNIEKKRDKINGLYEEFYLDKKTKKISLGMLMEKIINEESEKTLRLGQNLPSFQELRSESFKNGISKYIGAFAGWLKVLSLSEMDLTESTQLTNQDIDEVFYEYLLAQEENHINEADKNQYIISCFFIKALGEEYKRAKAIFFNQKQDDFHYELKEIREELQNKEEELKQEKQQLELEKKKMKEDMDKLSEELKKMQKENTLLQTEVESLQNFSKEVVAVREFIYSLRVEEEEIEDNILEDMVKELQEEKIAIIGGSHSWNQRMKELFPNFTLVNQDRKGADLRYLDNLDFVCINTATLSHSFYEKVMVRMSKNDTKLFFINGNKNMNITVPKIYMNTRK